MAVKKTIELEAKVDKAQKDLDGVAQSVQRIDDNLEEVKDTTSGVSKGVKGIGNALKAAGIGLAIAAFSKLAEVFNQNQKVTDAFSTAFEALSLAFNDFFKFLDRNVGTVIDYFKGLFENPVQSLKNFGQAIVDNVIERVNSALDALGFLGDAVVKVFSGDFVGAAESAKNAGKELFDVVTGVNNTFDKVAEVIPTVVSSITDYAKSTIDAARATVDLNKQAEVAAVINQGLIEKYDRQAEQQRQIRDDESKTIEERIAANEELGRILDEQSEKMLENVDITIKAAQAEFDKNQNQENYIALLEAQNEREAVLAQIEGFRSEQLINRISLEREVDDIKTEADEKEIERKEKLIELEKQRQQGIMDSIDAVAQAAGEESKIAKALFLLKTGMILKEQILTAQATMQRILASAAESGVDGAKGFMKAASAAPPPANVPLIAIFAAQAAGIAMSIKSAVSTAKSMVGSQAGGSVSGSGSVSTPQAPSFNIVGAAPENQLAQAIGEQEEKPIKAFVVSNEVTNAQALERNIVEGASIG
ncbi:MAG: hypothetical protein Tp1111SUR761211_44 [Prokaryotic dsDNA virus sp.]|nr:MAG: hypothetical protein Tp1111SUR761211_44 [Prokaryotic dsDNA virus sp.]|tara:strand:+ start:27205 stop:28806 length:1602 start_codon:yes stop_codon:yes gene_type:complete